MNLLKFQHLNDPSCIIMAGERSHCKLWLNWCCQTPGCLCRSPSAALKGHFLQIKAPFCLPISSTLHLY